MVGILALQGDFREHEALLHAIHVPTLQVKLPEDLAKIDRLIIPGGESTTIGKLLVLYNLRESIKERAKKGMPIWGTCAGAILLAKNIAEGRKGQPALELLDVTAHRNAFGRQVDSFETDIAMPIVGMKPFHAVFIRAPLLSDPGKDVVVVGQLDNKRIVAVKQGKLLATSFHPELSDDTRMHEYFLKF